jgi:hypothetical protein
MSKRKAQAITSGALEPALVPKRLCKITRNDGHRLLVTFKFNQDVPAGVAGRTRSRTVPKLTTTAPTVGPPASSKNSIRITSPHIGFGDKITKPHIGFRDGKVDFDESEDASHMDDSSDSYTERPRFASRQDHGKQARKTQVKPLAMIDIHAEKPEPFGNPTVWANTRSALGDSCPYYRLRQGSAHTKDGTVQGLLIDGYGSDRDVVLPQVVITSVYVFSPAPSNDMG